MKPPPAIAVAACAVAISNCFVGAAEIDLSKLPPPASRKVEYSSDIKPIFEQSCIRCHGAERPKSGFSLTTREAALRGGDNGVAIVPGNSAKSALILYVARLVPEMEMPPEGKGEPLTAEQVGLLRAWIDDGAPWSDAFGPEYAAHFSFAPALRWATVSGNAQRFQQHHWIRRTGSGGLADFRIAQKLTNGVSVAFEGRALTEDYKITLDLRKPDVGFARFGVEQFRRYYDERGPYFPFPSSGFATKVPHLFDLHRDLYLDVGTAFAEVGLTIPDWPRVTVGYDFHYKDGSKSIQQWGPVTQTTGGTNFVRNIFPAYKNVNEEVHVLRLDVSHEIAGVSLEDNFRAEFSDLKTKRFSGRTFSAGQVYPDGLTITRETHDQLQIANSLQGGKAVRDWLFLSAGYLFTDLEADATLRQHTADGAGNLAPGTFWISDNIVLEEHAHVFNLNSQVGPFNGFTAAAGLQAAFSETTGYGDTDLREGDPNDPTFPMADPAFVRNDIDRAALEETAVLRYTTIPATVLFADARWKQEQLALWEEQIGGHHDFLQDSDVRDSWQEYKGGFDVSPWRYLSFHAAYKKRLFKSDYDHNRDEQPHGTAGDGYPAFIRSRDSDSDLVEARLVARPNTWLKTSLSYQWATTDYETATDPSSISSTTGGNILAGRHNSHTYSANITATPWHRWSLSTTLSYQKSRIETAEHRDPAIARYSGDIASVLVSATFIVDRSTDITTSYTFSRARYGQNHFAGGLPLGIDYDLHGVQAGIRRRFSPSIAASAQYGFYKYDEPSAAHLNDYTAHMIFALLNVTLP